MGKIINLSTGKPLESNEDVMEKFYSKLSEFKNEIYYKDKPTLNPANFIHFTFHTFDGVNSGDDLLVIDGEQLKIIGFSSEKFFDDYNSEDILLVAIINDSQ